MSYVYLDLEALEDIVLDYLDELSDQDHQPYLFLIGRNAEERFVQSVFLPLGLNA